MKSVDHHAFSVQILRKIINNSSNFCVFPIFSIAIFNSDQYFSQLRIESGVFLFDFIRQIPELRPKST